jgi:hypothetical protein
VYAAASPLRLSPDHDLGHAGVFRSDRADEVACDEPSVFRAADEVLVARGAAGGKEDGHGGRDRPSFQKPPHDGRRPDPVQVELGVQNKIAAVGRPAGGASDQAFRSSIPD